MACSNAAFTHVPLSQDEYLRQLAAEQRQAGNYDVTPSYAYQFLLAQMPSTVRSGAYNERTHLLSGAEPIDEVQQQVERFKQQCRFLDQTAGVQQDTVRSHVTNQEGLKHSVKHYLSNANCDTAWIFFKGRESTDGLMYFEQVQEPPMPCVEFVSYVRQTFLEQKTRTGRPRCVKVVFLQRHGHVCTPAAVGGGQNNVYVSSLTSDDDDAAATPTVCVVDLGFSFNDDENRGPGKIVGKLADTVRTSNVIRYGGYQQIGADEEQGVVTSRRYGKCLRCSLIVILLCIIVMALTATLGVFLYKHTHK